MKMPYFERSGLALWLKRLEESKFSWPKKIEKEVIEISSEEIELLLEGVNIWTRFESVYLESII